MVSLYLITLYDVQYNTIHIEKRKNFFFLKGSCLWLGIATLCSGAVRLFVQYTVNALSL